YYSFIPSRRFISLCYDSLLIFVSFFFFFTHSATPDFYTLSLHDALPIYVIVETYFKGIDYRVYVVGNEAVAVAKRISPNVIGDRSEEHTSELQSRFDLVCRLLLEKKKKIQ